MKKLTKNLYSEEVQITFSEKIYNIDDTIYGYKVYYEYQHYFDYAIILNTNDLNLLVAEFTSHTDKEQFFKARAYDNQSKVYAISPFKYGKEFKQGIITTDEGNDLLKQNIKYLYKNNNAKSVVIDDNTITDNYSGTIIKSKDLPNLNGIVCLTQQKLKPNSGNCGEVAAMNVLNYWKYSGKDLYDKRTVQEVYSLVEQYMDVGENGSVIWQIEKGVKDYVNKNTMYSASTFVYWGAFWGYYKSDIDKGRPVIHCVSASGEAHAMTAYGYLETTDGKFLKVASGWSTNVQYVNFDIFSLKTGSYCTIKSK